MTISAHITRKDIARILGASINERWVRRNEKKLGLDTARVKSIRSPVLYRTRAVIVILTRQGFDMSQIRSSGSSVSDLGK